MNKPNRRDMKINTHLEFSRSIIQGVEIKQCRNSPYDYKPHLHNELSLGYILEGSTDLTLNDKTIHYEAGDGVLIPAFTTHRCAPNDINHWAYIILFIDPAYYGDAISFDHAKKITGAPVRKLFGFIKQLLSEKNPDMLENILIDLLLDYGEEARSGASSEESDIESIHDYIRNHVNEVISLEKLQQISELNKFTIIRNFKKQYVATPAAYHLQCRVAEAKKQLGAGVNVFDVCEEMGFYDQAHLIREFKKMYGITPAAYTGQLNR